MDEKKLKALIGLKLVSIRPMTAKEKDSQGWEGNTATSVLVFEDGSLIYPSSDDEGNGAGTLYGQNKKGDFFYVYSDKVIQ